MAGDGDRVVAALNLLSDKSRALDCTEILGLPAWERGHLMTTGKNSIRIEYRNIAPFWTSIPAKLWTGMRAPLFWAMARLRAIDDIVQHLRMAFLSAGMSTLKTMATLQMAASLW